MPKKSAKKKLFHLLILTIFLGVALKFALALKAQLGLSIPEAETAYLARSIPHAFTKEGKPILRYAKEHGYFLFPVQLFLLFPFVRILPTTSILLRIPQFITGTILMIVLLLIIIKRYEKTTNYNFLVAFAALIIIFSPWLQTITFYHLPEALSLTFSTLALLLITKIKKRTTNYKLFFSIYFLLLLSALSSWPGLFTSLLFPALFYILSRKGLKKRSRHPLLLITTLSFYIALTLVLFSNQQYVKDALSQNNFISQLKTSALAQEINERQKIDYLSSNKQFILPPLIRKFTYNKPLLATQKTIKQTVSLFDFEHLASPLASYDIVRLSGLLPKGNLPLIYLWEIPILVVGIFSLLKQRSKKDYWIPYFSISAVLPAIIFEKRAFASSAIMLLPICIIIEVEGVRFIIQSFLKLSPLIKKTAIFILIIPITLGILNFYYLFFFKESTHRTSHTYFFQQISKWLTQNHTKFQKVIVTTRFGPTHLMSSFYLDISPQEFWSAYLSPEITDQDEITKIKNIEFRQISFPYEDKSSKIAYIGFPGEFVKPGKDLDLRKIPERALVIDTIIAPDELVFNYGENLWIVTFQ